MRPLLTQIFDEGKCVYTSPTAMEIREIRKKEMDTLWDENKRLVNPAKVYVDLSDKLYDLKAKVLHELSNVKYHN